MADILSNLHPPFGAVRPKTRKGRGVGSGLGKTAGKGQKGQKARHPGNFSKTHFQGGQTPIQRRLPKSGFRNLFAIEVAAVNVESLSNAFEAGAVVDMDTLKLARLIDKRAERVKVLGNGDLDKKLTLKVHAISAGARAKVEAAGGSIELVPTTAVASEGSTTA
jgi:large subunit ribosomal protein L15